MASDPLPRSHLGSYMFASKRGESGAMAYTITYYKGEAEIDSLLWGGSRESAIDHARNHYGIQSEQNGATLVIVRDDGGHVVIQHPQSKSEHRDADHASPTLSNSRRQGSLPQ